MEPMTASRASGRSGQFAKIGALVCFVVACVILVVSHARPGKAGMRSAAQIQPALLASR